MPMMASPLRALHAGRDRIALFNGPWENYVDRKDATPIGVYESTVSDQWVNYVKAISSSLRPAASICATLLGSVSLLLVALRAMG